MRWATVGSPKGAHKGHTEEGAERPHTNPRYMAAAEAASDDKEQDRQYAKAAGAGVGILI